MGGSGQGGQVHGRATQGNQRYGTSRAGVSEACREMGGVAQEPLAVYSLRNPMRSWKSVSFFL